MANSVKTFCRVRSCPNFAEHKGYCETHKGERAFSRKTHPRNKLYNSRAWKDLRLAKLRRNPMCEVCSRAFATQVHHLEPARLRPDLALDMGNLQAICASCHGRESQRESISSVDRGGDQI